VDTLKSYLQDRGVTVADCRKDLGLHRVNCKLPVDPDFISIDTAAMLRDKLQSVNIRRSVQPEQIAIFKYLSFILVCGLYSKFHYYCSVLPPMTTVS